MGSVGEVVGSVPPPPYLLSSGASTVPGILLVHASFVKLLCGMNGFEGINCSRIDEKMTRNNQPYGQEIGTAASSKQYNNKQTRSGAMGTIAIDIKAPWFTIASVNRFRETSFRMNYLFFTIG